MDDKIKEFLNTLELKISNDTDRERLYNKNFQISIDRDYCLIPFGSEEYYEIKELLERLIENYM